MTFRTRLVLVATSAVLVVVVLGSLATYIVAYHSLVGSLDVTLAQDARDYVSGNEIGVLPIIENTCGRAAGYCSQMVWVDGKVNPGDPQVLPITPEVAQVAASLGAGPQLLFTTKVDGISVREIAYPVAGPYHYTNGALPGPDHGLRRGPPGHRAPDGRPRGAAQPGGGAVADHPDRRGPRRPARPLVGRTVLQPLDELTGSIEELARTTDVSRRLDPGGPDELGRLRRAFNRLLAALDSSRESQRQLVLDASHELRTPLTSLRTNMEVARRMQELDPDEREILIGDVLTQLDELTSLVADMAELARGDLPQRT